jgi:hypothetical protein
MKISQISQISQIFDPTIFQHAVLTYMICFDINLINNIDKQLVFKRSFCKKC